MNRLVRLKKWKKVLLGIIFALVLVRVYFVAFRGEVDKEYIVSTQYDLSEAEQIVCENVRQTFVCDSSRLNSLEFIFDNISDDKAGHVIIQIKKDEELIYQTILTLSNVNNLEWKKIFVNAEMEKEQRYTLILDASETCTQVPHVLVVSKEISAPEIIESVVDGKKVNGNIAVNYGYLRMPGIFDRLSVISLWIIFFLSMVALLDKSEKIKLSFDGAIGYAKKQVNPEILLIASELIGCFIVVNCSGISFQNPTKVFLYAFSIISTVNYEKKCSFVEKKAASSFQKLLIKSVYLYATFSLVGQRILIYPLTQKLTGEGLVILVCTYLWFVPIINSMFYYISECRTVLFSTAGCEMKMWKFVMISISLLIVPALYSLFANNPGNSSQDSITCMILQAQHLRGSGDWHPAFYCMVLRCIQTVWNSTYAVIFVQYFFWMYVCLEMIFYLKKKGIREKVLFILTAFLGFNASNYLQLNTIWKDVPYTLSVFWAFIILSKLLIECEEYKRGWYIYLELIVSLVGISLYRKNGIVTFVVIIAFLVVVLKRNVKIWISVLMSIGVLVTVKGPIYTYFEIQPVEDGMYVGLGQDILGVYYAGGEISESTLKMINVMTAYNNAEYNYTPTWAFQSNALNVEAREFIINYLDTFIKNPVVMSRAIIDREDAIWDIFAGQDSLLGCVNYYGTMDQDLTWIEQYETRRFVSLYNQTSALTDYTASSQWISAIMWRCGLLMLLGIIAVVFMFCIRKEWNYILLLSPTIGHILSLILSTGWSDFRYFWPLNLLNTALIFVVIIVVQEEKEDA